MPVATERGKSKRTGSDPRKRKMVSARIFFKAESYIIREQNLWKPSPQRLGPVGGEGGEGRAWRETRENHPPLKLAQGMLLWRLFVVVARLLFVPCQRFFDKVRPSSIVFLLYKKIGRDEII